MPLLLMLWCNVVKRNWTIILMQTVLGVSLLDFNRYNKHSQLNCKNLAPWRLRDEKT